jgi:hypothetical protein
MKSLKPRHYAEIAALIFAAQGAFAIIHRLRGAEYAGYVHDFNVVTDVGLAVLWLAAATAAMLHRGSRAFDLTCFATLTSLVFGTMFSIASARGLGLPFMVAAVVLVVALRRSLPAWRLGAGSEARRSAQAPPIPGARLSWTARH